MILNSAKDLDVYKKAYELAMTIFRLSKIFPNEERFALTGQIRRSSRSVCLNLREAWSKRRYEAHFTSKLPTVPAIHQPIRLWILPKIAHTHGRCHANYRAASMLADAPA